MTKIEIFEQVVAMMREDSSTKKDLKGADPDIYRRQITNEMMDEDFLYQMRCYLASFGIISHVSFRPKHRQEVGVRLRKFEDRLYVLNANPDTDLRVADQIFLINNQTIPEFYQVHRDYFVSETEERQYMEWAYFVAKSDTVTLLRNGQEQTISVHETKLTTHTPAFEYKQLSEETLYLKMENFFDETTIANLYQDISSAISTTKNVIVDVRVNHGGSDSLYFPLLRYALSDGKGFKDVIFSDDGMEFLYTKRNVELRLHDFRAMLKQKDISPETRKMLEQFMTELTVNKDKGYLLYDESDEAILPDVMGQAKPEKLFILSDVYCGSSGDNFVLMMKAFDKVTVIGRPTLGILDYSNCCTVDFGDYEFVFPTSRSLAIDKGQGMKDKGVIPDVFIPWTPEQLERDIDLEECLKLC
ncbi:Peptidase family S41 [Streptococcus constellatus]|uniref:Peptidase family S41 n=1 Tax=Streptococcus constellatus TaxID=76860 RepID=A0A564T3E2_STRCV|nr:S41 family peptidase [Streptococcus constellatus]VUX01890.1 Peptidase family S41 [Streptococcus constellatus]VUX03989.1 Peptidase family S41 [Streptococcus gordonii]